MKTSRKLHFTHFTGKGFSEKHERVWGSDTDEHRSQPGSRPGALGPAVVAGAAGTRIPSVLASPSPLCSKCHAGVFLLWTSCDVSSPAFPKLPQATALATFPQSPGPSRRSTRSPTVGTFQCRAWEQAFPFLPGIGLTIDPQIPVGFSLGFIGGLLAVMCGLHLPIHLLWERLLASAWA